jgi:hypothetical protein
MVFGPNGKAVVRVNPDATALKLDIVTEAPGVLVETIGVPNCP